MIKVIQYGAGPIGVSCIEAILAKRGALELVGVVDIDPNKVGKDVATLLDGVEPLGISISPSIESAPKADVVIHTTGSFLPDIRDQLVAIAEHGSNIVSSAEELSFPSLRHPKIADDIDRAARSAGVRIVGVGVNPGYAMDALALMATATCVDVKSVMARRIVDASLRRGPLQKKIGGGMSVTQFEEARAGGKFGHIGLMESVHLICHGLGWGITDSGETLEPVIASWDISTEHVRAEAGDVAGIRQHAWADASGDKRVDLHLEMFLGAPVPADRIKVAGDPPIELVVPGGIFGDTATVGMLVNTLPHVLDGQPGLRIVADLPLPRAFHTART